MNAVNTLLLAALLATALAVVIVILLRRSFRHLLVELCRSEVHGGFWFVFACIAIVLTTLLGSLFAFDSGEFERWREAGALDASLGIFRAGLFGLVLSLAGVALGAVVSTAIRSSTPPVAPPRL